MWNANGILVQGLTDQTGYVKNFTYVGINAYFQFPLDMYQDNESRHLTNEQRTRMVAGGKYLNLEFITSLDLYERYMRKCAEMNIPTRALFIESEYAGEVWNGVLPEKIFIGYEYCSIPIDEQIITDMDWYLPFSRYQKDLNEYGLFDTYTAVEDFVREYNQAFNAGKVGDGEIDAYICKVFLVINQKR